MQGVLRGEKIRQSLDLTNWEAANKAERDWEIQGKENVISLDAVYDRFASQYEVNGAAQATIRGGIANDHLQTAVLATSRFTLGGDVLFPEFFKE